MSLFSEGPVRARSFPAIPVYIDYRVHPKDLNVAVRAVGEKPRYLLPDQPERGLVTAQEYIDYLNRFQTVFQEGELRRRPNVPENEINDETLFQARSRTHRRTPMHSFGDPPPKGYRRLYLCCQAYRLRSQFESVTTISEMKSFLGACGSFSGITYLEKNDPVSLISFREWQYYFSKSKLRRKLRKDYPGADKFITGDLFDFNWKARIRHPIRTDLYSADHSLPKPGQLAIWVYCVSAMQAIGATIQLDILTGVHWRECARCGKTFQVGHRPEKMFCDVVCKNADCQRRRRAQIKEAELTSA